MSPIFMAERPAASADPLPVRPRSSLFVYLAPLALLACPAIAARAESGHGNFVQVASRQNKSPRSNFIVIRSVASQGPVESLLSPSVASASPSERVVLDDSTLEEFVAQKKLSLQPIFLHLSQRSSRDRDQFTVVGMRGHEVWRYELAGTSRRLSRVGEQVTLDAAARSDHENAVVGSRLVLAYRPTRDLPNGQALGDASTPVLTFVRTSEALFQVSRSSPGSFTISQVGVLESPR